MKPRLEPAPLAPEDLDIMALCASCSNSRSIEYCYCRRYWEADRRDADLMWWVQSVRHRPDGTGYRGAMNSAVSIVDENPVDVGGVLPAAGNITKFA